MRLFWNQKFSHSRRKSEERESRNLACNGESLPQLSPMRPEVFASGVTLSQQIKIWYGTFPFNYRYDVRSKSPSEAKRWSDMENRVYFQAMSEPAHLLISNLRLEDEGVYRCRVDFKNSPTRNLRINLTIIGKLQKNFCSFPVCVLSVSVSTTLVVMMMITIVMT